MKFISEVQVGSIRWINVTKVTPREIDYLKKQFDFHLSDLKDTLPPRQRPKLIAQHKYLFLVLLFPLYNPETHELDAAEIDIYIGPDYIITVHDNTLTPLRRTWRNISKNPKKYENLHNSSELVYEILEALYVYCFPILTHVGAEIDDLENEIFEVHKKELIRNITHLKRKIANFRMTMQNHRGVLKKMMMKDHYSLPEVRFGKEYSNLMQYSTDIWNYIETYNDASASLQSTYESLSGYNMNQTMRTLTIISVFTFPLTLIAATFSIPALGVPFRETPYGFEKIIALMLTTAILMFIFFKKRKWL